MTMTGFPLLLSSDRCLRSAQMLLYEHPDLSRHLLRCLCDSTRHPCLSCSPYPECRHFGTTCVVEIKGLQEVCTVTATPQSIFVQSVPVPSKSELFCVSSSDLSSVLLTGFPYFVTPDQPLRQFAVRRKLTVKSNFLSCQKCSRDFLCCFHVKNIAIVFLCKNIYCKTVMQVCGCCDHWYCFQNFCTFSAPVHWLRPDVRTEEK